MAALTKGGNMNSLRMRFSMLGVLFLLLFVAIVGTPQPAKACIFIMNQACNSECIAAYNYCRANPSGFWEGTYVITNCPISSVTACDWAFECLTCS
jgi:hypothetical protein